jgi:hypothetical protein
MRRNISRRFEWCRLGRRLRCWLRYGRRQGRDRLCVRSPCDPVPIADICGICGIGIPIWWRSSVAHCVPVESVQQSFPVEIETARRVTRMVEKQHTFMREIPPKTHVSEETVVGQSTSKILPSIESTVAILRNRSKSCCVNQLFQAKSRTCCLTSQTHL